MKPSPSPNLERSPAPAQPRPSGRKAIEHTAYTQPAREEWETPPPTPRDLNGLDSGIRRAVEIFQANSIETFQSCEGGPGHSFPEPTVDFYGTPEAGWRAVAVCLSHGLPIRSLRRVWDMLDVNELTGPYWEITFRRRFN